MNTVLKIAILDRVNSKVNPGGDTIQIYETANFFRKMGHDVIIFNELYPNLNGFDFACIFNLTTYSNAIINVIACEEYGVKYILFPIYWDLNSIKVPSYNFKSIIKKNIPNKLLFRLKYFKNKSSNKYVNISIVYNYLLRDEKKGIQYILKNAYAICPNSMAEQRHLQQNFQIEDSKFNIVYNGIKKDLYTKVININKNKNIICIGGIGPRKNQLTLAKAVHFSELKVKIIGKPQSQDINYFNKLNKYSNNVEILGWKNNDEVMKILSESSIHIQPSFIETPGISSMEAYALGCNIIVSNVEPVKEYFQDRAIYVNPYSAEDIKKALIETYEKSSAVDLKKIKEFNDKFCWENVLKSLNCIFE